MVTEDKVAGRFGASGFDGETFGGFGIGDADVDETRFEIFDGVGCVGEVPGYAEGSGTVLGERIYKGVCEG